MSRITGVATTQPDVAATYETVRQQLPSVEDIRGFVSAQQMAITQLAIQYCDALVSDTGLRADFFPGFDFNAAPATAFDHAGRSLVTGPLMEKFVGTGLATQPAETDIRNELDNLIDTLTSCGSSCPADCTETVVKAACAAVLGSATTLVQ